MRKPASPRSWRKEISKWLARCKPWKIMPRNPANHLKLFPVLANPTHHLELAVNLVALPLGFLRRVVLDVRCMDMKMVETTRHLARLVLAIQTVHVEAARRTRAVVAHLTQARPATKIYFATNPSRIIPVIPKGQN